MLFFNYLKHYILFILLIELVQFSLFTGSDTLPRDKNKKSRQRKDHNQSKNNSKKEIKKENKKTSFNLHNRVDRLRQQLHVGAYKRKIGRSDSKKQSKVLKSLQNLKELREKIRITNTHQKTHGFRRHSNPTSNQLSFQRPYRRPSYRTRQGKRRSFWSCFG
uniref:Uncharacterized protein n=1 Tax=Strongyloides venezuelensis TaxID=75913 RepID=A0A0K0FZI2_STRVS